MCWRAFGQRIFEDSDYRLVSSAVYDGVRVPIEAPKRRMKSAQAPEAFPLSVRPVRGQFGGK